VLTLNWTFRFLGAGLGIACSMPSYGAANQKRELGLTIAAPALRYGPVAKVNQALLIQFRGMDWIVHFCADRGLTLSAGNRVRALTSH
jgi:hypothetical protein